MKKKESVLYKKICGFLQVRKNYDGDVDDNNNDHHVIIITLFSNFFR